MSHLQGNSRGAQTLTVDRPLTCYPHPRGNKSEKEEVVGGKMNGSVESPGEPVLKEMVSVHFSRLEHSLVSDVLLFQIQSPEPGQGEHS